MNPTRMAEKPMFPTHRSNPSDGEPDAVKVARPVRRGGWRKPAGAVRPSAAPSLPNAVRWVWNEANYAGGGMYELDDDGGKADDAPIFVKRLHRVSEQVPGWRSRLLGQHSA